MSSPLEQAIRAFQIADVYIRETTIRMTENFDPKLEKDGASLDVQFRHKPRQRMVLTGHDEAKEVVERRFRVWIDAGVRLLRPLAPTDESNSPEASDIEGRILAEVDSCFIVEYLLIGDDVPSEEAQDEFSQRNAIYHLWPYFREYIHSTCLRTSLPPIILPMYTTPKRKQEKPSLASDEKV